MHLRMFWARHQPVCEDQKGRREEMGSSPNQHSLKKKVLIVSWFTQSKLGIKVAMDGPDEGHCWCVLETGGGWAHV